MRFSTFVLLAVSLLSPGVSYSYEKKIQGEITKTFHSQVEYKLKIETILTANKGFKKWFQPRPAAIPMDGANQKSQVIMTVQKILGSDYFTGLETLSSFDMGKTWSKPMAYPEHAWRDGKPHKIGVCDFTLAWHEPTKTILGIGHTVRYTKKGFAGFGYQRDTVWSSYNPKTGKWTPWKILEFPVTEDNRYYFNGVHGQWLVKNDGTLLVPVYFVGPKKGFMLTGAVAHLKYDGKEMSVLELGKELTHSVKRGLYEKSITWYQGKYYMTMRNDLKGYVAVSSDGMNFGPIKAWTFDDGHDLGSYNTQQKWVTHEKGLFLVYTRRGADNDHIPRNRAPLFIAEVDSEKLHVIRSSEKVAVPERGEMLGNFDATTISESETWITVAGRDAFFARIIWSKPNRLFGKIN